MSLLTVIILGIIQGITEFLPVSSTGHLILASHILQIPQSEFLKTFQIFIQLGSIVSVLVLYWKKLILDKETIKKIILAFIPTAIVGLIFYRFVRILLGNQMVVVLSLSIVGGFIIVFEHWYTKKSKNRKIEGITHTQAFLIGTIQVLALIPGVSRAAATIIGGLALGINRKTIVEFSFLLAVPTMFAAVGLDLFKQANLLTFDLVFYLIIGFIVSFLSAMGAIKFLLSFIKTHNFISFGIYRVIIALLFLIYV
jgi:undecaprenyl-diphosphatase